MPFPSMPSPEVKGQQTTGNVVPKVKGERALFHRLLVLTLSFVYALWATNTIPIRITKIKKIIMTATLERRESASLWARFCEWVTSTENRLYIGWFGVLMIPTLLTATSVFIIAFIAAPPVDIDGIREPVSGSLLYGNNIISGAVVPTSNAIGLHFYPIWEAASLDEWLYNGGPYQLSCLSLLLRYLLHTWVVSGNFLSV